MATSISSDRLLTPRFTKAPKERHSHNAFKQIRKFSSDIESGKIAGTRNQVSSVSKGYYQKMVLTQGMPSYVLSYADRFPSWQTWALQLSDNAVNAMTKRPQEFTKVMDDKIKELVAKEQDWAKVVLTAFGRSSSYANSAQRLVDYMQKTLDLGASEMGLQDLSELNNYINFIVAYEFYGRRGATVGVKIDPIYRKIFDKINADPVEYKKYDNIILALNELINPKTAMAMFDAEAPRTIALHSMVMGEFARPDSIYQTAKKLGTAVTPVKYQSALFYEEAGPMLLASSLAQAMRLTKEEVKVIATGGRISKTELKKQTDEIIKNVNRKYKSSSDADKKAKVEKIKATKKEKFANTKDFENISKGTSSSTKGIGTTDAIIKLKGISISLDIKFNKGGKDVYTHRSKKFKRPEIENSNVYGAMHQGERDSITSAFNLLSSMSAVFGSIPGFKSKSIISAVLRPVIMAMVADSSNVDQFLHQKQKELRNGVLSEQSQVVLINNRLYLFTDVLKMMRQAYFGPFDPKGNKGMGEYLKNVTMTGTKELEKLGKNELKYKGKEEFTGKRLNRTRTEKIGGDLLLPTDRYMLKRKKIIAGRHFKKRFEVRGRAMQADPTLMSVFKEFEKATESISFSIFYKLNLQDLKRGGASPW